MSFYRYVRLNWDDISFLTVQHVQVVLISVAFATVIGVGLGIATERTPRLRRGLLSLTGTLLTIPSFALFGLLDPGAGPGSGPAFVALTMYAVFPILRNTVTGTRGRRPGRRRRGPGHGAQLRPAAAPGAAAAGLAGDPQRHPGGDDHGGRTAAIGAAVRGPGLGQLIFSGLARIGGANALNEALSGVVGVVLIALVLDLLFLIIAGVTTPRGLHV